jgi:hormone-sensitive lipase
MSEHLIKVAQDNCDYFNENNSAIDRCFSELFSVIIEVVAKADLDVEQIKAFAPLYDFDEKTPGNGYRSFVFVYDSALEKTLQLSKEIKVKRGSIFFRSRHYRK